MQTPFERVETAINNVTEGLITVGGMQGALLQASNKHYRGFQLTTNVCKPEFVTLVKTIKESKKNPEADARAILTPDRIMAPHQFETMAKTLHDKYKPGEGGAAPASGKSKPAASKTKPASSKAGSGSADDSKEVENIVFRLAVARSTEKKFREQYEKSVAEVKELERELDRKRKRDQA